LESISWSCVKKWKQKSCDWTVEVENPVTNQKLDWKSASGIENYVQVESQLPELKTTLSSWKSFCFKFKILKLTFKSKIGGRRGHDRMVVGFTTTYAISVHHHWCCELESWSGRGVQYYVIKFFGDLRHVSGFLRVLWFPPPIKLTATI
jgi:hypothetical protein